MTDEVLEIEPLGADVDTQEQPLLVRTFHGPTLGWRNDPKEGVGGVPVVGLPPTQVNHLARWSSIDGTTIKDSAAILGDNGSLVTTGTNSMFGVVNRTDPFNLATQATLRRIGTLASLTISEFGDVITWDSLATVRALGPVPPPGDSTTRLATTEFVTTAISGIGPGGLGRETLTANRSYFVRDPAGGPPIGNDTTGDGTAGAPFATIKKAWDTIVAKLDMAGFTATIDVGPGIFDGGLRAIIPPLGGNIVISGAGHAITLWKNTTGDHVFSVRTSTIAVIQNMQMTSSAGAACLHAIGGGIIKLGFGMNFGSSPNSTHMQAEAGGILETSIGYLISGGGYAHYLVANGTIWNLTNSIVEIIETPNFTGAFALASVSGVLSLAGVTWPAVANHGATGIRYQANSNGVITTNGAGVTFLPGDAAHPQPTSTGGQYV